jgi:hypothetical protein
MDEPSDHEELLSWEQVPSLNFQNNKLRTCVSCFNDPSYPDMVKGITCYSTVDCVDNKQWKERKYRSYRV